MCSDWSAVIGTTTALTGLLPYTNYSVQVVFASDWLRPTYTVFRCWPTLLLETETSHLQLHVLLNQMVSKKLIIDIILTPDCIPLETILYRKLALS